MSSAPIQTGIRHRTITEHFDRLGRNGYWSGLYEEYADPRDRWSFIRRQQRIEALLDDLAVPGAKVAEVGPGTGNLVRFFAARQCRYRAFDSAPAMVRETNAQIAVHYKELGEASAWIADVYRLPLEGDWADVVVASGVFEYLDDAHAAARELARITRRPTASQPGGVALISFPNARSLNRLLGERLSMLTTMWQGLKRLAGREVGEPDVMRRPFDTAAVEDTFGPAGWSLEDVAYYDVEVLPYPLKRLLPDTAFAAKQRVELAGRGPHARLANGFVAKLRRM